MIDIFKNIRRVFNYNFTSKPREYKDGYWDCYTLFEIAFSRCTLYNLHTKLTEAEKEVQKINRQMAVERKQREEERISLTTKQAQLETILQRLVQDAKVDKAHIKYKTRVNIYHTLNADMSDSAKVDALKRITAGWEHL